LNRVNEQKVESLPHSSFEQYQPGKTVTPAATVFVADDGAKTTLTASALLRTRRQRLPEQATTGVTLRIVGSDDEEQQQKGSKTMQSFFFWRTGRLAQQQQRT
jgi:hypothetical protein